MKRITVLDLETDPFRVNRIPKPFVAGHFDGSKYATWWSPDCVSKSVHALESEPESIVYVHNGGKFDFFWYLPHASGDCRIINGRIVSMRIGRHEFRDSFAIMPFPLRNYKKDEIDYEHMEANVREQYREEILDYLRGDLTYLYELCTTFQAEFGDGLTIGGSGLRQLKKHHKFKCGSSGFDQKFREPFYHGGRNQCFQTGIIHGSVKVLDVNSMYPHVMRSVLHPVGTGHMVSNRIERDTCFVVVQGKNDGAFPVHTKEGLDFTLSYGTFHTTIHEFQAAIDTGSFRPSRIVKTYNFPNRATFAEWVDEFYGKRQSFKANGDRIRDLLYKYSLNAPYGKFAQNPENFFDWRITAASDPPLAEVCQHCNGSGGCIEDCHICKYWRDDDETECVFCNRSGFRWHLAEINSNYNLWSARTMHHAYYNVCTGASITGASRAVLLRGIRASIGPLYCDTDSIICHDSTLHTDDGELGAWKIEATADVSVICGKKLYALFSWSEPSRKEKDPPAEKIRIGGRTAYLVKKAHKGARLTGADLLTIAKGGEIEYANPVPNFKLNGQHQFVKRRIRRTA